VTGTATRSIPCTVRVYADNIHNMSTGPRKWF